MKKFNSKDYINITILVFIFLIILFSIVGFDKINGSTVDWNSQHWMIPEYFRNLFNDTNDLFPSFAFNLGGGQNIYNLSYYGLLSPITLLSYLVPFISMINYIQIVMGLIVISSIVLVYYWLRRRFDSKYAFLGALLFLLSAPLIYHTHRHIMFINYMPFLILGLIGVDRYFEKGKCSLLTISVFLTIISSYYYSVGAIICIVIYGIFKYIEINEKISIKKFIVDGIKFALPIIIGVCLSGILILPTFYALLNGRSDITATVNVASLFVPTLNIEQILYNSYTIGLTSIFVFAIIGGLFKNKSIKFLSITFAIIFLFPIIIYLLSGFMYVRGKVLIPLLPMAVFLVTVILDKLTLKRNKTFEIVLLVVSLLEIYVHISSKQYPLIIDVVIVFITYIFYLKYKNKNIIIYPLCMCALLSCLVNNYSDKLETIEYYNNQNDYSYYEELSMLTKFDDTIHRVGIDIYGMSSTNRVVDTSYLLPSIYSSLENQNYFNFANNEISNEMESRIATSIMSSKNILFNTYMGTKYILTDGVVPIGYKSITDNIYYNENVLPIGFATSKTMSSVYYNNLSYPDKQYALLSSIIVDNNEEDNFKPVAELEKPKYEMTYKNISIKENTDKYIIDSKSNGELNIDLNKKYKDKLLFISFDMQYSETCLIGDTSITINGVKNTLSCKGWTYHNKNYSFEYVISSNDTIGTLNILFTEGKYEISNIKMYSLDYKNIVNFVESVDEFKFDKNLTKGDDIVGEINVTENGYFKISIPYEEKGFEVYLDDKLIPYEKVDGSFIGFSIHEGNHQIHIKYTSPYLKEGMILSLCSSLLLIPMIYSDIFNKKKRK